MNSIISSFQGPFTTDLRTPPCKKWGLLWSFCLNTGKYWSDKNHSVFLKKHHKLTQCTMQKNTVLLPPSFLVFFFINTFIGESLFRFCDICYEYFEINFKNYFVI